MIIFPGGSYTIPAEKLADLRQLLRTGLVRLRALKQNIAHRNTPQWLRVLQLAGEFISQLARFLWDNRVTLALTVGSAFTGNISGVVSGVAVLTGTGLQALTHDTTADKEQSNGEAIKPKPQQLTEVQ